MGSFRACGVLLTRLGLFELPLIASISHAFAELHFTFNEHVRIWLDDWLSSESQVFFWREIHNTALNITITNIQLFLTGETMLLK